MTNQEIANWIKSWFKEHPKCKDLTEMYEDFNAIPELETYDTTGKLTELIFGMGPLKYISYIPDGMFCGYNILDITIPNYITSIGDAAFYGCGAIRSIVIPSRVTFIGDGAFSHCTSLTDVVIPISVNLIGENAFEFCTSLTSIDYIGTKSQWQDISLSEDWKFKSSIRTIKCSDGIIEIN